MSTAESRAGVNPGGYLRDDGERLRGWLMLFACLPILLAGCAISDDPHQGGFVSGVVGLAGGGYQQRVDDREGAYQGELDAQQRLTAQARALEAERARVKGDLSRAQARLADQQRKIAAERARLNSARSRSAADQARLRRLDQAQAQLVSTKGQLRAAEDDDLAVSDARTRVQAINDELDQIDSMVGVVSGSRF